MPALLRSYCLLTVQTCGRKHTLTVRWTRACVVMLPADALSVDLHPADALSCGCAVLLMPFLLMPFPADALSC